MSKQAHLLLLLIPPCHRLKEHFCTQVTKSVEDISVALLCIWCNHCVCILANYSSYWAHLLILLITQNIRVVCLLMVVHFSLTRLVMQFEVTIRLYGLRVYTPPRSTSDRRDSLSNLTLRRCLRTIMKGRCQRMIDFICCLVCGSCLLLNSCGKLWLVPLFPNHVWM